MYVYRWWPDDGKGNFLTYSKFQDHFTGLGLDKTKPIRANAGPITNYKTCSASDWYLLLLECCAREINDEFQDNISKIVGNNRHMKASVKSFNRMKWKSEFDYSKETYQPYGARLQDIVRCCVKCKDCDELLSIFDDIIKQFSQSGIVKVKNTFDKSMDIEFGYRAVYVCVVYKSIKNEKMKMICEIQLTLDDVITVRNQMHIFYGFYRSEQANELCQF